jgi:acetoin utilization protein AcuB
VLVKDLMTPSLVTIGHDATIADAWRLMRAQQVRHLPVLDADRRLIGMLTDHDLRQVILERYAREEPHQLGPSLARLRIDEVMTWAVVTVRPDADIREAARLMCEKKLGALAVADGARVVGMLTATDVVQVVAAMDR